MCLRFVPRNRHQRHPLRRSPQLLDQKAIALVAETWHLPARGSQRSLETHLLAELVPSARLVRQQLAETTESPSTDALGLLADALGPKQQQLPSSTLLASTVHYLPTAVHCYSRRTDLLDH